MFVLDGDLVAMTFLALEGTKVVSQFIVADQAWPGQGLGVAVKATPVLALAAEGVA